MAIYLGFGYFWFQARSDDMIVSAGVRHRRPEVDEVLLSQPRVAECGVVSLADERRGQVHRRAGLRPARRPRPGRRAAGPGEAEARPVQVPPAIEFQPSLPRTDTGKRQRFKLRELRVDRLIPSHG
jgi:2-aminobenzoate-CoA ligase